MCDPVNIEIEYQILLKDLKSTVEGLLVSQVANVWNVYGGLKRLHNAIEKIFKHRCKLQRPDGEPDCLNFIQGIEWLQPNSSSVSNECTYHQHIPIHFKYNKASIWLYRNLENHALSQKLSWLLSDKDHLLSCYDDNAFLCQEKYSEATLICLRAIERYQPCLLSEINPLLLLTKLVDSGKVHRRSSSFPIVGTSHEWSKPKIQGPRIQLTGSKDMEEFLHRNKRLSHNNISQSKRVGHITLPKSDHTNTMSTTKTSSPMTKTCGKLKAWSSLTILHIDHTEPMFRERSATISQYLTLPNTPTHIPTHLPNQHLSPSVLKVDYSMLQLDTNINVNVSKIPTALPKPNNAQQILVRDAIHIENENKLVEKKKAIHDSGILKTSKNNTQLRDGLSIHSKPIQNFNKPDQTVSGSDPEYYFMSLAILAGQRDVHRCPKRSFIEDGGSSITPMATGYFPRPVEGQTLTSFLSSPQFSHTSAELDRENAHFSISEAMIAAIEQVKFNKRVQVERQDSDEEIEHLRQRIRNIKKQRQEKDCLPDDMSHQNDDYSSRIPSTPTKTPSASPSADTIVDDLDVDSASNLADTRSLRSLNSTPSDSEVLTRLRGAPDGQSDCVLSAEGVALSLIKKFSSKQLPKASELQWLVSENEVSQSLLPLPTSWPVNPDAVGSSSTSPISTPLRGTADWAPPRPQIIFTIHPHPVRQDLMTKQNYRCAGCGMRVAVKYAARFRYCEYLGKYFCTGCHSNQTSVIPARVLVKWDFTRYPVSNFSYRLLDQMISDPLFNVDANNPGLYKKCKQLNNCLTLRTQLSNLKDFIALCRFAEQVTEHLKKAPTYMINEPHVYSIQDLLSVKKGNLQTQLKDYVDIALSHTTKCLLCKARGFVCQVCLNNDIIYPWQLKKVSRCAKCGACYHSKCWRPTKPCKRCLRLKTRQETE